MKKYVIISGLDLSDTNRGTAALGYGSFSFLKEKGLLNDECRVLCFKYPINLFKLKNWKDRLYTEKIQDLRVQFAEISIPFWERKFFLMFNCFFPFGKLKRYLHQVEYVAAINGGDGFSDIYNTHTFYYRLTETLYAMKINIPVIFLPQTIGPFFDLKNKIIANKILKYAKYVFVRDNRYQDELIKNNVNYELCKDLSYYMKPETVDVNIKSNAVGLNISGLAYSNGFRGLAGQFDNYKYLIINLINALQQLRIPVYIIPHSYNFNTPELNNDDMEASKVVYENLDNKTNVYLIDRELTAPQVKYCISKMSYFIGTRMHANFAAIYTNVPVYGLAYSYKFEGAFRENGVYNNNISLINNISKEDCQDIIKNILIDYNLRHK